MALTRYDIGGGLYIIGDPDGYARELVRSQSFRLWSQVAVSYGAGLLRSQLSSAPTTDYSREQIDAVPTYAIMCGDSGQLRPALRAVGYVGCYALFRPNLYVVRRVGGVEGTFAFGCKVGLGWAVSQPPLMTFEFGAKTGIVWDIAPQVIGTFEFGSKTGLRWSTTVSEPFSFGCRVGMSFIGEVKKAPTVQLGARAGISWAPRLGTPQTCLTGDGAPPPAPEETRNYVF